MKKIQKDFKKYGKVILEVIPPIVIATSIPVASPFIALPVAEKMIEWGFGALSITGAMASIGVLSVASAPLVYRRLTALEGS